MPDFIEQDLAGSLFERTSLRGSTFHQVRLNDTRMLEVDLEGADIRGALLHRVKLSGAELVDVDISAELHRVTVNGVDIGPLIEAELNGRMPERALMRPDDAEGFRRGYAAIERLWEGTVERARQLPEADLHKSIDGEWSFVQTLRHLSFASAAWADRMVRGNLSPWHPLDLPWDEAPGWPDIPWDRDAEPTLDEVLAVRTERQAMVRSVLADLTDEQLAGSVTRGEPGWPVAEDFPVKECLRIILNEEWEHRQFAERDLAALASPPAPISTTAPSDPTAPAAPTQES